MDYRDGPNLRLDEQFPMDEAALRRELRRAKLHLGRVETTVPEFVRGTFVPVAFISFDLDLYSSTRDALKRRREAGVPMPDTVCYHSRKLRSVTEKGQYV
jgi:hypothetical protein